MPPGPPHRGRYVSASELAEYAFCPRAHYYQQHPEGRATSAESSVRADAGVRYHTRVARSERSWSESSALPWVVATLVGAGLLLGVLWGSIP